MAALSLERFRWWGQKAFDAVLYLPIIIPDVTMAVMMLAFFNETADLINLIPFNKLNILRLTNPIDYMSHHANIFPWYSGIFTTIK